MLKTFDILPMPKAGDSLKWGLMSQTDNEDIPGRVNVPIVSRPAGVARPLSYPQAT